MKLSKQKLHLATWMSNQSYSSTTGKPLPLTINRDFWELPDRKGSYIGTLTSTTVEDDNAIRFTATAQQMAAGPNMFEFLFDLQQRAEGKLCLFLTAEDLTNLSEVMDMAKGQWWEKEQLRQQQVKMGAAGPNSAIDSLIHSLNQPYEGASQNETDDIPF